MKNILDVLAERVVLADGAMGSLLFESGVDAARCYDVLNLDEPGLVSDIHAAYLQAGAEVIETNTFGANRYKLEPHDLGGDVVEINRRGAELARKAAGDHAWVAGAMGPLGRLRDKEPEADEIAAIFTEQAEALVSGGVDLLMLETFTSLSHLVIALKAVKARADVPVAAQMVFTDRGKSFSGRLPSDCFRILRENGADIVGLNCSIGPKGSRDVMRGAGVAEGHVQGPVSVLPNAGFPERTGDRLIYGSSPDYFARLTAECVDYGARLVGGCCGTGPAHIKALHDLLRKDEERVAVQVATSILPTQSGQQEESSFGDAAESAFSSKLGKKYMVLVELDPPKHLDTSHALEGAAALAEAGVDAITVAENPLAVPRLSNVVLAHQIRERTGVETIVHLTGRDRNLVGMQSTLMGMAALGLQNVLVVTGDPPSVGAEDKVTGVYDLRSFNLMSLLSRFNEGQNHYGDDMKRKAGFCIGGAFNPNTKNIAMQVKRLERKMENGARYFLTQPVYTVEKARETAEAVTHLDVPVFLGIMPLASYRNAEFLHNEFPGIRIPEEVRERMKNAGDKGMGEGVEVAWELLKEVHSLFAGVYIMPPFNRYAMALELLKRVRSL